jgi:ribosome-associated protein
MASDSALSLLSIAAQAAFDKGAVDPVALDVSGPLPLTEIFFIVSGRNERNVSAIASEVEDKLIASGTKPIRREGKAEGRWVLLDFGDLIVHVFHEEERLYYGLERLWKDCPALAVPEFDARPVDFE